MLMCIRLLASVDLKDYIKFEPDEIDWVNDPISKVTLFSPDTIDLSNYPNLADFEGLSGIISPGIMNIDPASNLFYATDESLKDLRNLDNWSQNRPTHFSTSYNKSTNVNTILVSRHAPNCGTD